MDARTHRQTARKHIPSNSPVSGGDIKILYQLLKLSENFTVVEIGHPVSVSVCLCTVFKNLS